MLILGVKMNFGYIRGSYGRTQNNRTSYLEGRSIYSRGIKSTGTTKTKSLLDDSTKINGSTISSAVGFKADIGTAADTTVKIDKGTFNQVMDYSMKNPANKWDEIGCDGTKKWVVIDGQRFDYSLSKDEKEAFKKRWKTSCEAYNKTETDKDKSKSNTDEKKLVSISLDKDNKLKVDKNEKESNSAKLTNLMKKPRVVKMLSDIIKANNHRSISLDVE